MIDKILDIMTPQEILDLTEFGVANPILPERFPTFDDLNVRRGSIRNLSLLPVKSDELRAHYHTFSREDLARNLREQIGDAKFMFSKNDYPYLVPSNTAQYIIWINDPLTPRVEVAEFIATVVKERNFKLHDLILFERPLGVTTKLVKGSFPLIRHIHLWTRDVYSSM